MNVDPYFRHLRLTSRVPLVPAACSGGESARDSLQNVGVVLALRANAPRRGRRQSGRYDEVINKHFLLDAMDARLAAFYRQNPPDLKCPVDLCSALVAYQPINDMNGSQAATRCSVPSRRICGRRPAMASLFVRPGRQPARRFYPLLFLALLLGCVDRQSANAPIVDGGPAIVITGKARSPDASRPEPNSANMDTAVDFLTSTDLAVSPSTADTGVDAPGDIGGDVLIRDTGFIWETSSPLDVRREASVPALQRCESNAQGKIDGLSCSDTAPSCYALGDFTCSNRPNICTCKGGVYVCAPIATDYFSDGRECNPEWDCTGESKPHCGGSPGPYGYRCEKGKWTFYDGCANSGCYRFPGPLQPSLISEAQVTSYRIHTGDTCPAKGDCRFAPPGGFNGGNLITCRCQVGTFACSDEPTPPAAPSTDGGIRDARND